MLMSGDRLCTYAIRHSLSANPYVGSTISGRMTGTRNRVLQRFEALGRQLVAVVSEDSKFVGLIRGMLVSSPGLQIRLHVTFELAWLPSEPRLVSHRQT